MSHVVIVPYTSDYADLAMRLKGTLGAEASIPGTYVAGSWLDATLLKPLMAQRIAGGQATRHDAWIFDADLEVAKPDALPELWALLDDADVAIHVHTTDLDKPYRQQEGNKVSAGVVGFKASAAGRAALAYWCGLCQYEDPAPFHLPEQVFLYRTYLWCQRAGVRVATIPLKFNARPKSAGGPHDPIPEDEIVIRHVPASRERRKR